MNERQKLLVAELDRATEILLGTYRTNGKLTRPMKTPVSVRDAKQQIRKLQSTIDRWEKVEQRRLRVIRKRIGEREMFLKHEILSTKDADSARVLRLIHRFARTGK